MGEALITRRGGGKLEFVCTQVNYSSAGTGAADRLNLAIPNAGEFLVVIVPTSNYAYNFNFIAHIKNYTVIDVICDDISNNIPSPEEEAWVMNGTTLKQNWPSGSATYLKGHIYQVK